MRKWIGLSLVVLLLLIGGAVFATREITYAQYTGAEEAAQRVLDTTPLYKIDELTPYTGGMDGFFIQGTDELGRVMYVWAVAEKVVATQYADRGLSRDKAIEAAKKPVWSKQLVRDTIKNLSLQPVAEVVHATPGPVLFGAKTEFSSAPSKFVWEIYGKLKDGTYGYTYLDFQSGQVLWQIALPDPKQST